MILMTNSYQFYGMVRFRLKQNLSSLYNSVNKLYKASVYKTPLHKQWIVQDYIHIVENLTLFVLCTYDLYETMRAYSTEKTYCEKQ